MATRKDQKVKIGRKSKQDIPRPAREGPLRNERTVKEVAHAVMRRRSKALRALAGAPVTAMLIAERSERDDELADQFARLVATQRRSAAHDENDPGGVRGGKTRSNNGNARGRSYQDSAVVHGHPTEIGVDSYSS